MQRGQKDRPLTKSAYQARAAAAAPSPRSRSSQQPGVSNPQQSRAGNRALVPVYVLPENLRSVQEFVLSLGQPIFSPPTSAQDPLLEFEGLDIPGSPRLESQVADGLEEYDSPDEYSESFELSSALSQLSVSSHPATSASQRRAPAFHSSSLSQASPSTPAGCARSASPLKSNKRYYSIIVGKKAGVFWDEWDNVEPLIKGVSGSRHKSFSTYKEALKCYSDAKVERKVRIVRDPGDDAIYGPRSLAVQ